MYKYILDIQIYTGQSGHYRTSVVILVVLQNYHSRVTVGKRPNLDNYIIQISEILSVLREETIIDLVIIIQAVSHRHSGAQTLKGTSQTA